MTATLDADALAEFGLRSINIWIQKYLPRFRKIEDEMRSNAHVSLARSIPIALGGENPKGYVITAVRRAMKDEVRNCIAREKYFSREDSYADEPGAWENTILRSPTTPDPEPRPDVVAMFREEMGRETPIKRRRTPVKGHEWATFAAIVNERPDAPNREIAAVFNRATGRHFDGSQVLKARKELSLPLGGSETRSMRTGKAEVSP